MYEERFYRREIKGSALLTYTVVDVESDLMIYSDKMLQGEVERWTHYYRSQIQAYGQIKPEFFSSLEPLILLESAPEIVRHMHSASARVGVGPMAAVAGAISEYVGRKLMSECREIIIENGGDIFLKSDEEKRIQIYAGKSPLSNKIALKVPPSPNGIGICTSAGTVGHSLSFGRADAVVILSEDVLLADAVATATGNRVKAKDQILEGLEFARGVEGVIGVVIIVEDEIGCSGMIELC